MRLIDSSEASRVKNSIVSQLYTTAVRHAGVTVLLAWRLSHCKQIGLVSVVTLTRCVTGSHQEK